MLVFEVHSKPTFSYSESIVDKLCLKVKLCTIKVYICFLI